VELAFKWPAGGEGVLVSTCMTFQFGFLFFLVQVRIYKMTLETVDIDIEHVVSG
jgi:hypothetical protein